MTTVFGHSCTDVLTYCGIKPWIRGTNWMITAVRYYMLKYRLEFLCGEHTALLQWGLIIKGPYIHPWAWRTIACWGRVAVSAAWLSIVCVDVGRYNDRWQGHTAISVTFPSDVQYVLFRTGDRWETAAVHPSPHTTLQGHKHSSPTAQS